MHLTNDCFVLTPEKAIELVDENTIGTLLALPYLHCNAACNRHKLQSNDRSMFSILNRCD